MKKVVISLLILASGILSAQNPFLPYATNAHDSIMLLIDRQSTMRYGYAEFCTQNQRLLYDQTVDSFLTFTANGAANGWIENRIFVNPAEVGATNPGIYSYMDLLNRMVRDMPELYIWSSYIPRQTSTGYYVRLWKSYTPSQYAYEMAQIDSIAGVILAQITPEMSRMEQVRLLHDSICGHTRYGGMSSAYAGNIKGVFLDQRAVCEGWSRAMLYLCQKAGIRCLYVDGALNQTPDEATPTWGAHAWNLVEVDNQWYLVDCTSDGGLGGIGHRAFLKGQDYFDANYTYNYNGTGGNENLTAYPTLPTLSPTDWTATTDLHAVSTAGATKVLRGGEVLIQRNGRTYNVVGQEK